MSRARVVASVAVLGLAAFAVAAYARQAQPLDMVPADAGADAPPAETGGGFFDWSTWALPMDDIARATNDLYGETDMQQQAQAQAAINPDANVRAFLQVLQQCEGTAGKGDPYRVCYAYSHVINDLSDHPAVTGEWSGVKLSDVQCRGAGLGPGCKSTAAGAYQLIKPTWLMVRGGLPDFGPASQDAAAIELLRQCGALDRIRVGDLSGAVARARKIWASLPGANYAGQGMRSMSQVSAWYSAAGGTTA